MTLGIEPSLLDFSNRVPSANHILLIIQRVNFAKRKEESVSQYRCAHPFICILMCPLSPTSHINNIVLSSGLQLLQVEHLHSSSHTYNSQLGSCIYLIFLLIIVSVNFANVKYKSRYLYM